MNTDRTDIHESLKIDGFVVTMKQAEEISELLCIIKYGESGPRRYRKLLVFLDRIKQEAKES